MNSNFQQTDREMRNQFLHGSLAAITASLIAGLAGCGSSGPEIVPVSGAVTLDESPLTEGVISFASSEGFVSSAPLDPEGRFQLSSQYGPGIPAGTYRVTVVPQSLDPRKMSMGSKEPPHIHKIPTKYQYADRSGLTATINDGASDFTFKMFSEE